MFCQHQIQVTHDVNAPKCENREFTGNTSFIESICDVGLTGVDNGLVQYMSGNTTEYDDVK